jgi:hypothetical protein
MEFEIESSKEESSVIKFQMDTDGFKREMKRVVQQQARQNLGDSGRSLQHEVDAVFDPRSGRSVDELKADLETRMRRLDFSFDDHEMAEWAETISRGERIAIQFKGDVRF